MKGLIVTADHTVQLVDDIPMPEIGPYEALVRIDCCMICNGTDMEILCGQLPEAAEYPLMLGHESAGHVIRIGEKVRSFQPGDQVIVKMQNGEYAYYIVESINQYHYQHVPWEVMQHDGESRLTLITCLGDFSSSAGTSMHRVVAVCRPYTGE